MVDFVVLSFVFCFLELRTVAIFCQCWCILSWTEYLLNLATIHLGQLGLINRRTLCMGLTGKNLTLPDVDTHGFPMTIQGARGDFDVLPFSLP